MNISDPNLLNNSVFSYRLIDTPSSISLLFYLWMRRFWSCLCYACIKSCRNVRKEKKKILGTQAGIKFSPMPCLFSITPLFSNSLVKFVKWMKHDTVSGLDTEYSSLNRVDSIEPFRFFCLPAPPVWSVKETGEGFKESECIANTDLCRNLRDQGWAASE